jgi:hypothetical protein
LALPLSRGEVFLVLALIFVFNQHRFTVITAELQSGVVHVFVGTAGCHYSAMWLRPTTRVVDSLCHQMSITTEFVGSAVRCSPAAGREGPSRYQPFVAADLLLNVVKRCASAALNARLSVAYNLIVAADACFWIHSDSVTTHRLSISDVDDLVMTTYGHVSERETTATRCP